MVGRLWSIISKSRRQCPKLKHDSESLPVYARYETHYGEEQSRISRETSIIAQDEREIRWTRPLISFLSLRASDQYLSPLEGLFTDEFVYGHAWDPFMSSCIKGWQHSSLNSAVLLLYVLLHLHRSKYRFHRLI
jgi:hypothetical protein